MSERKKGEGIRKRSRVEWERGERDIFCLRTAVFNP
jgi:hypothetical protein